MIFYDHMYDRKQRYKADRKGRLSTFISFSFLCQ